MTMTPALARAAGQDAANRRMRAASRTSWNRADYNVAVRTMNKLMEQVDGRFVATLSPVAETLMQRHMTRIKAA